MKYLIEITYETDSLSEDEGERDEKAIMTIGRSHNENKWYIYIETLDDNARCYFENYSYFNNSKKFDDFIIYAQQNKLSGTLIEYYYGQERELSLISDDKLINLTLLETIFKKEYIK